MKKAIVLSTLFMFSFTLLAERYDSIAVNNIITIATARGTIHLDSGTNRSRIKDMGNRTTFNNMNLWVSAQKPTGEILSAIGSFYYYKSDFVYGPVATNYNSSYDFKYNRTWKVTKAQINYHIANYATLGYNPINAIANWPGNGDVSNGKAGILAPFYDKNGNGLYEPLHGDYPLIKGDEAIFFMCNDDRGGHQQTNGEKLGFEIHGMLFGFVSSDDNEKNTLYCSYKVINRSTTQYKNVKIGVYSDFNIGNKNDDFIGCDTLTNMFFSYNGDMIDETVGSTTGFGTSRPAAAVKFLNHKMHSFAYIEVSSPTPALLTRTKDTSINHLLNGRWPNGSSITIGGRGFGGTIPTRYCYPSNPCNIDSSANWNEHWGFAGERIGLGTIDTFTFLPKTAKCIDIAMGYQLDVASPCGYASAEQIRIDWSPVTQTFYDANIGIHCNESLPEIPTGIYDIKNAIAITIYPNPATETVTIDYGNHDWSKYHNISLSVQNIMGQELYQSELPAYSAVHRVHVGRFASGMYQVIIKNDDGVVVGRSKLCVE